MATVGSWLPLTHGIEAARALVAGAPWSDVTGLVAKEAAHRHRSTCRSGMVLLAYFENESRRTASLERV